MTLAAFLAVCAGGAALGQMTGTFRRLGPLVTLAGLAAACTTALLIGPTDGVTVGEVRLSGSTYASAFLAVAGAACLLLWLVRLGSGGPDHLAPATLAVLGGLGIALTAADPRVALTAAAAAAVAGTAGSVRGGNKSEKPDNQLSEARTMALLVASLLFASIAISRPSWTDQDGPVFVLGLLGLAAALAVRSGSVPFHVPAARLAKCGPSMAPALLLVWIPAGLGLVAVSWSPTTFGLRSDWLTATVTAIQIVAVATLILGAVGALLHDDLTEIAVYSIVGDSGFILLALASRDGGAAEPARLWLLAFLAAKTGFVAWAVAASHAFGSANLRGLYGWLRRTPLLGLALIAIAAATLGWPGSPVFEARSKLIELALPGSLGLLGPAVVALALLCYGRLLLIGLLTPSEAVRAATGERPRWSPVRPPLSGEAAVAPATAVAVETTTAAPAKTASRPKKRTSRSAAAAELLPAQTAPQASPPDGAGTAPESPAGPGWHDRLVLAWGLNGTLRVSFAVLAAAALSLTLALGGLGASNASSGGIPLDAAANFTPRPTPSPTPAPTPSPEPTFAPIGSYNPGTSGGPGPSSSPSGSGGPSSSPSGSGGPTRSSIPAPLPIR